MALQRTKDAIVAAVVAALEFVCEDYEWIAIRDQEGAERRTRIGAKLRPSHEWEDNIRLRRVMRGTAGFLLPAYSEHYVSIVVRDMLDFGYARRGSRLVLIGSNRGCRGEDMPEPHACAMQDAVLIAILGVVE